jgi:hypothetical protein
MIQNKPKKATMREAHQIELDGIKQNTVDIMAMKNDLTEIKTNQKHLDGQIEKIDKKVEKIDGRLWAIMLLVVGSTVAHYFM